MARSRGHANGIEAWVNNACSIRVFCLLSLLEKRRNLTNKYHSSLNQHQANERNKRRIWIYIFIYLRKVNQQKILIFSHAYKILKQTEMLLRIQWTKSEIKEKDNGITTMFKSVLPDAADMVAVVKGYCLNACLDGTHRVKPLSQWKPRIITITRSLIRALATWRSCIQWDLLILRFFHEYLHFRSSISRQLV